MSAGVVQRYVHLDTALIIAADQIAEEIARLLAGGGVAERAGDQAGADVGEFAGGGLIGRFWGQSGKSPIGDRSGLAAEHSGHRIAALG